MLNRKLVARELRRIAEELDNHLNIDKILQMDESEAEELAYSTTDKQVLDKLAKYDDEGPKIGVAENTNTSSETLDYLSHDESKWVRCSVAQNKNTSLKTLRFLSKDEDEEVRQAVLENPHFRWQGTQDVKISHNGPKNCINEVNFSEDERYKEAECTFDSHTNTGYVEWVSQSEKYPSDDFIREIKRAYSYNFGSCKIRIKFCSRDNWGDWETFVVNC